MANSTFIIQSNDDNRAWYSGGNVAFVMFGNSGGNAFNSVIRIQNVTIPKNTPILSAEFRGEAADNLSGEDCKVKVYAVASDNVTAAPTTVQGCEDLVLTTAHSDKTIPTTSTGDLVTITDLASVIQEVINREGWASGNALMIVIKDNSSTEDAIRSLTTYSSASEAAKRPRLYLEYSDNTITSSIVISPDVSAELLKGKPGDIYECSIPISPQVSGTVFVAPYINASIPVSPQLSSTMYREAEIAASISVSPQMSATVSFGWEATFNTSFPALTLAAEGYDSAVGELVKSFPSLTLAATGEPSLDGAYAISLPSLTLSATGVCDGGGEFAKSFPIKTIAATGIISEHGSANLTLRGMYLEGEALGGVIGELSQNLPGLTLSAEAFQNEIGEANLTLPMMRLYAFTTPSAYDAMVLNLKNKGLTSFSNYDFNSMCRFNGVHLGASPTGIFDLDTGDTDNGTLVEWNFRTGYLDMIDTTVKPNVKKRLKQAWLSYKSNGDVMITVLQPDGTSYEYDLSGIEVYDTGLRVKFGKGFRSRYLALDVSNVDGSTIELDTMKLHYDKVEKER